MTVNFIRGVVLSTETGPQVMQAAAVVSFDNLGLRGQVRGE